MRAGAMILLLIAISACSAPGITDAYRAERHMYQTETRLRELRAEALPLDVARLRQLAADFSGVALSIPEDGPVPMRELRGRAWMRAAECHFDLVDSVRAELVLAALAASCTDIPSTFGEVSLKLGRVSELHGQYRAAISHYVNVVERIEPDPGPDPNSPPDPEAPPEELTANDFVLGLPLRAARIAARDTTVTDPRRFYEAARTYYADRLDDRSPFIRIEATVLLAQVLGDLGQWQEASTTLDVIEDRIPGVVMSRYEPADVRLASVQAQIQACRFGETPADSVRALVEALIRDYPHGDAAPTALFAMAECEHELGSIRAAHLDLARLVRDYPTAAVAPSAQLLRAKLFAEEQDLRDAQRVLRSLPLEFPTSEAALRAPLEIVAYFRNAGDAAGELAALERAEQRYRGILRRYPAGPHQYATREKLVSVYDLQNRHREAVNELLAMCDAVAQPAQRPGLLRAAASRTELQLGEPARAATIYQRLADEFPNTRLGQAALREVRRLVDSQEK